MLKFNNNSLLNKLLKHTGTYMGISVLIILSTLVYSYELFDSSNVIRYTFLAVSLTVLFVCRIGKKTLVPKSFGVISFLLFLTIQGMSILWATNLGEALFDFSKWLIIVGIIVLTYNGLKRHQVHTVCMLSTTAVIIFCLSLLATIPQILQMDSLSWNSRYGITSFFTHKGTYSMQLLLFIPFLFLRTQLPLKGKWVYGIIIILIVGLVFFIQARAVMLAFFMSFFTFWMVKIIKKTSKRQVIRPNIASIVLALILGFATVGSCRIISEEKAFAPDVPSSYLSTASMWERQGLWKTTFRLVDRHPFTGCGVGNWKINCPGESVKDVFSMDVLDMAFIRPHNDFLRILAESGYISLFALFVALAYLIITLLFNQASGKYAVLKAVVSLSFIVGILVFAFFDFPFDRIELVLWSSLLFGLGIDSTNCIGSPIPKRGRIVMTSVCLLLVGLGAARWYSEWNYAQVVKYLPQGKWDKVELYSIKARSLLCSISPNNDPYAYYTGMAREFQGKQSIDYYKLAIKDSPYHKQCLTDLGRVEYEVEKDTLLSIYHLKEAIRISPNYATAYFTLSEVFRREGRMNEALETLYELDLNKKQKVVDNVIRCYMNPGDAESFSRFTVGEEKTRKQEQITKIKSQTAGVQFKDK